MNENRRLSYAIIAVGFILANIGAYQAGQMSALRQVRADLERIQVLINAQSALSPPIALGSPSATGCLTRSGPCIDRFENTGIVCTCANGTAQSRTILSTDKDFLGFWELIREDIPCC